MEYKNKMRVNVHIYIFIIVALIAALNDNIIYFLNLDYDVSLAISSIIIISLNIFLIKKEKLEIKSDFSKWDLIPIVPYLIISILLIVRIDDFVDTISYHCYNQRNPFIDRVNFDLFPSSSFFFPLGDRINYIFIRLFGYRIGQLVSVYVSIIVFYQVKNFLDLLVPDIKKSTKTCVAGLILYTFSTNLNIAEYFIDRFSMIITLELIYIYIKEINFCEEKIYLYSAFLLVGILIGIKISNLIFAIFILFLILIKSIKEYKKINIFDILIVIGLSILPWGVYSLNCYIQTGNPIFPFYNSIFKSKYYNLISSKDSRLGAKDFSEIILWPLIIRRNYIRGDDITNLVDPIWAIGYLNIIFRLFIEKNKSGKKLLVITIATTYLWILFVSGYVRYGMFIGILYHIFNMITLVESIKFIKTKVKVKRNLIYAIITTFIMIYSIKVNGEYLYKRINYSFDELKNKNIVNCIDEKTYDIDGVWISSRYNTASIELIREKDDPMYNLDIIEELDPMMEVSSCYSEVSKKMFYEKIKRKEFIYCFK